MRLAWATDLHLNFAGAAACERFFASIIEAEPDGLVITGDIGESDSWKSQLDRVQDRIQKPVYFVLGNHDYYRSTIAAVRKRAEGCPGWLVMRGAMLLSPGAALVGHDGWGDGRLGDYANSNVMLNDYLLIGELVHKNRFVRQLVLSSNTAQNGAARSVTGIRGDSRSRTFALK